MRSALPEGRAARGALSGLAGALVGGLVFAALTAGGAAGASAATAADDTPATSIAGAVTAKGYDPDWESSPFPDLAVTVSQTKGLVAQGLKVSWTGGAESTPPTQQSGGQNYLQIAQCWGDDPENPGRPDRTTCQYGAFGTPGATRDGNRTEGSVAASDAALTTTAAGALDPAYTSIPFRSATGDTIASVVDGRRVPGVDVNTNPFFTQYTSNEIPWAGTGADGTGSTKFEVQTVTQSRGLGCGARTSDDAAATSGASCWLVVIPRGTADTGESANVSSGLFADNWKHHLAVKLDFRPVGLRCAIGAAERQLAGSELISRAVSSWQPTLCAQDGGSVFTLLTGTESDAATAANAAAGDAPLALTSLPYSGPDEDRLVYAPIGLTSVTVGFAIDRFPAQDGSASEEALARARLPLTDMKLTPRLIAKLLTSSYLDSLPYQADRGHLGANPRNLLFDPDFRAINDPEWSQQAIAGVAVADMLLPQGRSDVATALWTYVMADPEAREFLAGMPDDWGMVVNPFASTTPEKNPTGTGLTLPRDSFPKPDPVEVAATPNGPAAINSVTWRPYTNDLDSAAYATLRGDGLVLSAWDPAGNPPRYSRSPRNLPGTQAVISLTDGAAAEKYQLVTAALRNPAGEFVLPTTEGLTAAASAMTATGSQPQVRSFAPTTDEAARAAGAYPLAMPVYAAASPYLGDAGVRSVYADFMRYAADQGQVPGVETGQLPAGYAPLPDSWRVQARAAATALENGLTAAAPTPSAAPAGDTAGISSGALPAAGSTSAGGSGAAAGASAGAAGAAPAAEATNPSASGAVAGALAGARTAADPDSGPLPAALPISLLAALIAAAVVLLIPRLPRRP
ncbi:hypothetical protein ACO03V_06765 [Microbacterium sp. HMH0099]|uniref:hypothetical protein n=1 Tax=Microbacterium sp. HMH0099 TaxID=3414026 RepID=UPI003BF71988